MLRSVLLRFLRVFVVGGVASLVSIPLLTDLSALSFEAFVIAAFNAFLAGGLAALDKALRYQSD